MNVNAVAPGYIRGTRLTSARDEGDGHRASRPRRSSRRSRPRSRSAAPASPTTSPASSRSSPRPTPTTSPARCIEIHGGLEIIKVVDGSHDGKVVTLEEAVGLVQDGDVVALQNMATQAAPMALVRELIRQEKRDLGLVCLVGGIGGRLAGGGRVPSTA